MIVTERSGKMYKNSVLTVLLFVFIIACTTAVTAQDEGESSLGLSLGATGFHLLDEHAAYLIFRGTGITPSVLYSFTDGRDKHYADIMFTYSNLRTVSEVYKTPFLAGRLRYSCLRQVAEGNLFNHSLDLSAGLSVSSFFSKASYKFQMPGLWANGIKTWYGSHSADVSIQAGYNTGENSRVELLCYLPVISNVSRPAYSSSGDYNYEKNDWQIRPFGNTMFLTGNFGFNALLSWVHNPRNKMAFTISYEFNYNHCTKPDRVTLFSNSLRACIMFNLKSGAKE